MAKRSMKEVAGAVHWTFWLDGVGVLPAMPVIYALVNLTSLSANAVTLIGTAFGLAGAFAAWRGAWLVAAPLYFVCFVFDTCDGAVARLRRQSSRAGAVLDLRCDRLVFTLSILAHMAYFTARGMAVEAMLATAYAMAFYLADVLWMYNPPSQEGAAPRADPAPTAPGARGARSLLKAMAHCEERLRPSPYFCEIVFFSAAALAPDQRRPLYVFACAAMGWNLVVDGLARPLGRRLSAALPR